MVRPLETVARRWEIVVLMGARHMALEVMKKAESGLLSEELHPKIYELLVKT